MAADAFKSIRVLELYHDFLSGKIINKREAAAQYHVNVRSIQRDIDSIRDFLAEQSVVQGYTQNIEYDKRANGYILVSERKDRLSPGEVLAACKIILASRAFTKDQVSQYLQTILDRCVSPKEKSEVQKCIANELFYYQTPAHPAIDAEILWTLSNAIRNQQAIEIGYLRLKDKQVVQRRVNPVGLLFSEYYFYLLAVIDAPDIRKDFCKKNDPFPTIYRVDRIQEIYLTDEHFSVPYADKFKEGEYKNRVQYMYGGEPQKLIFEYYGPSVEAVLDRFPTATVSVNDDDVMTITADIFGNGVIMWLLSQGNRVKVLQPDSIIDEILQSAESIARLYCDK